MITLGPRSTPEKLAQTRSFYAQMQTSISAAALGYTAQACNCMGPQPGESKCPCALRAEMRQASDMIRDGVVIGGQRYKLVKDNEA